MRYLALATDFDGTIAHHGLVHDDVLDALARCRESGRRLLLVTGRELPDLARTFPHLNYFDFVVAENGATLYSPESQKERLLAERPPETFVTALQSRGVGPISVGQVIVATWSPHEVTVLETIRDLGLELQVIFNKGAVMVLPTGVNKATGLAAALNELRLSPHNVVAVGDAENDHALLHCVEAGVAVANAVPMLLERADLVTAGDHGLGVIDLIHRLVERDLAELDPRLTRHHVLLGSDIDGREYRVSPRGTNILLGGPSAASSAWAAAFVDGLTKQTRQICLIDLVGDCAPMLNPGAASHQRADVERTIHELEDPRQNGLVDLCEIPPPQQSAVMADLYRRLAGLYRSTGHPHWIIMRLPDRLGATDAADVDTTNLFRQGCCDSMLLITDAEADQMGARFATMFHVLVCVGHDRLANMRRLLRSMNVDARDPVSVPLENTDALVWSPNSSGPFPLRALKD